MQFRKGAAIAQVITGLIVAGLVAVACWNDISNNIKYGLTISTEMATILAVFGAVVAVVPFAAGFVGWNRTFVAAFAVCVAVSMFASATAYLQEQGEKLTTAASKADAYKAAKADAETQRATLAQIGEKADTQTLAALVDTAKAKLAGEKAKAADATGEAADQACAMRKDCKAADTALAAILERLGQARNREAAQAALDKAKAVMVGGNAQGSAAAEWIAARTGGDADAIARTIAILMALAVICGTQVVAACGHTAAELIAGGMTSYASSSPTPKPTKPVKTKKRLSKDEALRIIRAHIDRSGGQMVASQSQIAKLFPGVPRTTICGKRGWLAQWVAAGELEAEANVWRATKRKAA